MFEALRDLTAEQWLTMVILPLAVGLLLVVFGVLIPKFPLLVKSAAVWLMDVIGNFWFTTSLSLRHLFMSKKQKGREAEARRKIMVYMEHLREREDERAKDLMERVKRSQPPRIR